MAKDIIYLTGEDIKRIKDGKEITKNGLPIVYERPKPKTQEQLIAERRADMPRKYRPVYDKAVGGRSLRAAINAFCLECNGWEYKEVRNCTCLECPLNAVRPYQQKLKPSQTGGSPEKVAVKEGVEKINSPDLIKSDR